MNDKDSKLIFEMYSETIINPETERRAEVARDMAETKEDRQAAEEILQFIRSQVKHPGKVREIWNKLKHIYTRNYER